VLGLTSSGEIIASPLPVATDICRRWSGNPPVGPARRFPRPPPPSAIKPKPNRKVGLLGKTRHGRAGRNDKPPAPSVTIRNMPAALRVTERTALLRQLSGAFTIVTRRGYALTHGGGDSAWNCVAAWPRLRDKLIGPQS
jgi:hypothetical protein